MHPLLADGENMFKQVLSKLHEYKIMPPKICDHICYRVETDARYHYLKEEFLKYGVLAGEEMVGGRLISIIKLNTPLKYLNYIIECLELPAPKKSKYYSEGLEHAEFIVPKLRPFMQMHSSLPLKLKGSFDDINPEITLKINATFVAKFHPQGILEVLELEK